MTLHYSATLSVQDGDGNYYITPCILLALLYKCGLLSTSSIGWNVLEHAF